MVHEFEGRTEKEAIDLAIESLGLNRDEIDVEILENKKKGFLFGGGKVKIRVHLSEEDEERDVIEPQDEIEKSLLEFLTEMINRMSLDGDVYLVSREEGRLVYEIQSDDAAILIGRQGKTLDAFQLLMNIYAGRISQSRIRVVVDAEDYRQRREQQLIRIAHTVADQVTRTKSSKLLDPMNPFERRLIHTALNDMRNVETVSEGEGLYKKIRVFYRDGTE